MNVDWIQLEYWESINHPEAWLKLVSGGVVSLVALLSVLIATYLTYKYAVKHSKNNHNTQIEIDHLQRDIEALEKIWELLAYISFAESDKAIVQWREEMGDDNKKIKRYYYRVKNLKQFMLEEVERVFYLEHAGLFLPQSIKGQIFEYRSLLMGLYLCHENDPMSSDDLPVLIKNPKLIEKLQKMDEALNKDIKSELELRYQQLLITNK